MENIIFLYTIIFIFVYKIIANNVNLTLYAFTYSDSDAYYSELVKRFNDFSLKQSLGISLELNIINKSNSSLTSDEIADKLDSYLKYSSKEDNKEESLDLITYDVIYSGRFSNYFVDLKPYISEEKIQSFIPSSIETCTTLEDKLISLVCKSNLLKWIIIYMKYSLLI